MINQNWVLWLTAWDSEYIHLFSFYGWAQISTSRWEKEGGAVERLGWEPESRPERELTSAHALPLPAPQPQARRRGRAGTKASDVPSTVSLRLFWCFYLLFHIILSQEKLRNY